MNLRDVNAQLAQLILDVNLGRVNRAGLAERLRELAERLAPGELKLSGEVAPASKTASVPKAHRDAWKRVWAYWVHATGKTRALESPKRKKAVLARLRDGYTETDIKLAIDGALTSDHHVQNDYLDLTLICRDATKIEWFKERGGESPAHGAARPPTEKEGKIAKLEEDAMAALEAGDMKRYEALQAEIERTRRDG